MVYSMEMCRISRRCAQITDVFHDALMVGVCLQPSDASLLEDGLDSIRICISENFNEGHFALDGRQSANPGVSGGFSAWHAGSNDCPWLSRHARG